MPDKNDTSANVELTTAAAFLIIVGGERARVLVLKRRRNVSGVTVLLAPRGICSAGEQSLANVAVVILVIDVAGLLFVEG